MSANEPPAVDINTIDPSQSIRKDFLWNFAAG